MKIRRDALLGALEAVHPGVSKQEIVEQSNCYVFNDDMVQTYNDEIACSIDSPLVGFKGAVTAEPLLHLLRKLVEEELTVECSEVELLIKAKRKRAGFRFEKELLLPIANVQLPTEWKPLHPDFGEGVRMVKDCASKDDGRFDITCIHITPKYVEACDNIQGCRYKVPTKIQTPFLVRQAALKHILGLDMTEIAETEHWVHFRNGPGLLLSCRRYVENYPNLKETLRAKGRPLVFPKGLVEAIDKAEVFSNEHSGSGRVMVQLRQDKLRLDGRGARGWYSEVADVRYDGPPIKFMIAPKLLEELVKRTTSCNVSEARLIVQGQKFKYVGCLGKPEDD